MTRQFFSRRLQDGQVRYLLIGRRAIAALGAPVLTSDYDLWIDIDDTEEIERAGTGVELFPNHEAAEARTRGRYDS